MVYFVTSDYLNSLMAGAIQETIDLYRKSKNTICFDGNNCVAEKEINDFVYSTPYFSFDLKAFLYSRDYIVFIKLTKEWLNDFLGKTCLWAGSDEWLFYDVKFICKPTLNESSEREKLDLAPHNKAIFYCTRFS